MVITMEKNASLMVDERENKVKNGGGRVELEVSDYMTHLTIDIIIFTTFGSSYIKKERKCLNKLHSSILWVKGINNDFVQYQDTSSFIHLCPIPLIIFTHN
jgi:hypothetical protein